MTKSPGYTEPKLCTYGNDLRKDWFVYFSLITPEGIKVPKQFRGGINRIKSKEERIKAGNALRQFWKEKLKRGWPDFKENIIPDLDRMEFNDALDFGLKHCDVARKTRSCYKSTVKFFKATAEEMMLSKMLIRDIEKQHIKLILARIKQKRNWSNKAYNKHLSYIQAVLSQCEEWKLIKYNPAHKIKTLRVTESDKYKPYTKEEKKKIAEHLYLHHYRFFVLFQIIYHTGIREKEVLALKIKDVDLNNKLISIYPDIERENSKTKNIRLVPVNNHLLSFLRELKLEGYPSDYYIFGSKGNAGRNKYERGPMHDPDYFKPSPFHIKVDTVTRFWKTVIKDGLGIDKYLYAAKRTGGDDKILAGINLDALRELFGHTSKFMTEKYAKKIKEIYRQEIIEKSPEF